MPTVEYKFTPNEIVYVIDECNDNLYVTSGVVVRVRMEVLVSETVIRYDIRLEGQRGTKEFVEKDVFTATGSPAMYEVMSEYQSRLF